MQNDPCAVEIHAYWALVIRDISIVSLNRFEALMASFADLTHENTLVVPYVKGSADRHAN